MRARRWRWAVAGAPLPPLDVAAPPVVWHVDLDACPSPALQRASAILSLDERHRAAAFRFERDRRRYLAGRLALRHLLGTYAGTEPEALVIERLAHGKPALAAGTLSFNLSHAGSAMLLAVHPSYGVGVDLERAQPAFSISDLVPRVLTGREAAVLRALAAEARPAAFMRYWTCKEAVLKARGEGLLRTPTEVEVDASGTEVAIRRLPPSYPPCGDWELRAWDEGPHVAALAWVLPAPGRG